MHFFCCAYINLPILFFVRFSDKNEQNTNYYPKKQYICTFFIEE
jgi:hypothetical protein